MVPTSSRSLVELSTDEHETTFLNVTQMLSSLSSGSSSRIEGGEKHEIYMAAFGDHLFYDLFLQDQGGWPPRPPGSATEPDDFPRLGFSLAKVGLLQVYLLIPTHAYYTVNGHISKRGSQVNNHFICRNETVL